MPAEEANALFFAQPPSLSSNSSQASTTVLSRNEPLFPTWFQRTEFSPKTMEPNEIQCRLISVRFVNLSARGSLMEHPTCRMSVECVNSLDRRDCHVVEAPRNRLSRRSFPILFGCGENGSDRRLVDIAVKVQDHQRQLDRIARTMEGIENKLDDILAKAEKGPAVSGPAEPARTPAPQVVDFRNTPEYGQIVATLSAIQQQLNLTQSDLAETKEGLVNRRDKTDTMGPPGLRQPFRMGQNPQETQKTLDALVEKFAAQIDDPIRRAEFEADVEQLKQINADGRSVQQVSDLLVADLKQRLDNASDDSTRKWLERQLSELTSPSGNDLDAAVERVRNLENLMRLSQMRDKYGIPSSVMAESGLPVVKPISYATRVTESGSVGLVIIAPEPVVADQLLINIQNPHPPEQ